VSGKAKDQIVEEAKKLSKIVADYWSPPSVEHIENWFEQFDEDVRLPMVAELGHILAKSYFSAKTTEDFWKGLITAKKLVGDDSVEFWKKANFFDGQQGGASQSELLGLFGTLLKSESGLRREECGSKGGPVIYIDDVLFSGNRLVNDLRHWIPNEAPKSCEFHAIFMGIHSGGAFYARKAIAQMAAEAEKEIKLNIWRAIAFENFSNVGAASDVFRLRKLPDDEQTAKYIEAYVQGEPAPLRPEKESNQSRFFSSEKSRNLLEQTFWSVGLHIRQIAGNLKTTHRPLGYTSTNSSNKLGFGALVVTYRNCPNNCPLAFWVGDPWHPLFERKTN
jgi:hypothetical protein